METSGNIVVGKADVEPSAAAHTMGVREGNARTHLVRERGMARIGRFFVAAKVRRSTGVNPKAHEPIDPRMPLLTPA